MNKTEKSFGLAHENSKANDGCCEKEEGWKHGETDERPRSGCESQPLRRAMDGKKK